MEQATNDAEQNIHEFFKRLIADRDQRIARLENELAAAGQQSRDLHQTVQQLRDDYQALRQQKGGFGFKMLLICGFFSAVAGFGLHWLVSRTGGEPSRVFQKFKDETQFNIEYDISQGNFEKVENTLKNSLEKYEYAPIQPELEFFRKIMGATRRKFSDTILPEASTDGFSLKAEESATSIQDKAKKSLTVTEPEVSIRSEANTSAEKLGKLKKGETAGIWDKTTSLSKMTLTKGGQKYEVEDYWYKIETKTGLEGWVFGHFTSRSLKRMTLVE